MDLASLQHGIIISCQAIPGNPFYNTGTMPLMARAAEAGGAVGIRANGPEDITAIKRGTGLPVIGIYKTEPSPDHVYITPTFEHARAIAAAGCDIIALDATLRPRPDGAEMPALIARIRGELGLPVMADISTFEEGVRAAEAGCEIVATTLAGYTAYSSATLGPDFALLAKLAAALDVPIIAEGRFWSPEDVNQGFAAGAFAVVIGKAATNPMAITRHFVENLLPLAPSNEQLAVTESVNPDSVDIDTKSIPEILAIMNRNDRQAPLAVGQVLPEIARAVEIIVHALQHGGRLFYIGAGTSGRLAIADAAECPPTFGVAPELVQALIAGGQDAVFQAREGCEDKERMGVVELKRRKFSARDVLVGISASGRAPYVVGALRYAQSLHAPTVAVINNPRGRMAEFADVLIAPIVGPEVIMGSTRLKAGTAAKTVLNMLSTASLIKLGRVSGNMMSNMRITCDKLRDRALNMVMLSAGLERDAAQALLDETHYDVAAALQRAKMP